MVGSLNADGMAPVTIELIARDLESFVRDRFEIESDDDFFSTKLNLWEEGYVDSAGVVELIAHLEDTYSIEIPKAMLFDPKFTSVDGIAESVSMLL